MPGRSANKGREEFLSRPRLLAISEFGPRALVYHQGSRYRVYKVNLDFGSDAIEGHAYPSDCDDEAIMPMKKIDVATIEAARRG